MFMENRVQQVGMTRLLTMWGRWSSEELPTGIPLEILTKRKLAEAGETKRRNGEGDSFTTHVSSLHIQLRKARP
jgi:hypothetical protein